MLRKTLLSSSLTLLSPNCLKKKKKKNQKNNIQKIVKNRGLGSETPPATSSSSGSSSRSFPFTLLEKPTSSSAFKVNYNHRSTCLSSVYKAQFIFVNNSGLSEKHFEFVIKTNKCLFLFWCFKYFLYNLRVLLLII